MMTSKEKKEIGAKVGTGVAIGVVGMVFLPTITTLSFLGWAGYEGYKWAKKTGKIK